MNRCIVTGAVVAAVLFAGCVLPNPEASPGGDTGAAADRDSTPDLDRPLGDLRLFARVPSVPGYPEGLHVWEDFVFVGTIPYDHPDEPSVLYVYDRWTGARLADVPVTGEDYGTAMRGLSGFIVDGAGRPYAGEVGSGTVIRWTQSGDAWVQETYATLPDLPSCASSSAPCSPTGDDRAPLPNDLVFDDAGNLYVTDSFQATIWRVPPGGGDAEVWFQDARIDHEFGPNGIRISPDGTRVVFTVTGPFEAGLGGALPDALHGVLDDGLVVYALPFVDAPSPGDLEVFHWFGPASFPDGLTYGASGNLYVNLLGPNRIAVLDPDGQEVARYPDAVTAITHDPPVDFPASLVFDDERRALLVTNYASLYAQETGDRSRFAILDVFVDDVSAPMSRPVVP